MELEMSEEIKPADNESNMENANLGTDGVNTQYSQVQGHRGTQLNPNQTDNGEEE
jgi:hypothetical protein